MKSAVFLEHLTSDSVSEREQLCSLELVSQLDSWSNSGKASSQTRAGVRAMKENSSWVTELSSKAIFPEHREKYSMKVSLRRPFIQLKLALNLLGGTGRTSKLLCWVFSPPTATRMEDQGWLREAAAAFYPGSTLGTLVYLAKQQPQHKNPFLGEGYWRGEGHWTDGGSPNCKAP